MRRLCACFSFSNSNIVLLSLATSFCSCCMVSACAQQASAHWVMSLVVVVVVVVVDVVVTASIFSPSFNSFSRSFLSLRAACHLGDKKIAACFALSLPPLMCAINNSVRLQRTSAPSVCDCGCYVVANVRVKGKLRTRCLACPLGEKGAIVSPRQFQGPESCLRYSLDSSSFRTTSCNVTNNNLARN